MYSFRVVAVDGEYQTPSRVQVGNLVNLLVIVYLNITNRHRLVQSVNTYLNIAAGHQPQQSTLASSGWFIGMLLAIIFLLGVCLVVCLVKRNRGGKYAVQVSLVAFVVPVVVVVAEEQCNNVQQCSTM